MNHPYYLYALVCGTSFLLTFLLVPVFRALALRYNIVDHPNEDRKIHERTMPYLGGVPFYIGFIATVLAITIFWPEYRSPMFFPMGLVGTLIFLMGIYDDIRDLGSRTKLGIELALSCLLFFWGYHTMGLSNPFGGTFYIGWFAILITPLWITGVINAINFCDGLDGLASGLVFICAASLFIIGIREGLVFSCIIMAYLMGATLAFLKYNFSPASVFMGDAGALFLGFVLGTTTLMVQQKGVAVITLTVPMIVLAVPFVDMLLSSYRRLLRARAGQFFSPDRHHLHHRLLNVGLTHRQVVLTLYYVSICMGLLAFVFSIMPVPYKSLVFFLAVLIIVLGVVVLRFIESLSRKIDGPPSEEQKEAA